MLPKTPGIPGLSTASPATGPAASADSGLSAALRNALGSAPDPSHRPGAGLTTGQDIARRARSEKPSHRNATPPRGHFGPRSGHK